MGDIIKLQARLELEVDYFILIFVLKNAVGPVDQSV